MNNKGPAKHAISFVSRLQVIIVPQRTACCGNRYSLVKIIPGGTGGNLGPGTLYRRLSDVCQICLKNARAVGSNRAATPGSDIDIAFIGLGFTPNSS